jgi:hypothetical protein
VISLALLGVLLSCNQAGSLAAGSGNAALPPDSSPMTAGKKSAIEGSGIRGAMVAAWGNAPANPPTYECVKIFDASGQKLVATGTCSGIWGQFSVALPPGRYIVEKQGARTAVEVARGQWADLSPQQPPVPIP